MIVTISKQHSVSKIDAEYQITSYFETKIQKTLFIFKLFRFDPETSKCKYPYLDILKQQLDKLRLIISCFKIKKLETLFLSEITQSEPETSK